jgi:hypothetical protein
MVPIGGGFVIVAEAEGNASAIGAHLRCGAIGPKQKIDWSDHAWIQAIGVRAE